MTTTLNLLWEGFHVFVNKVEKKAVPRLLRNETLQTNYKGVKLSCVTYPNDICVSSHALLIFYTVIFQVYFIAEYTGQRGKRLCLQRYL